MAESKQPKTNKPESAAESFSADERAAMRERAKELRAQAKGADRAAKGEEDLLTKIAEMEPADRILAEGIHALIKGLAPELESKTWYGMPAYAKDGKVICFFQSAGKFKTRYSTLGFSEDAQLDSGVMWPSSFAILELDDAAAKMITELVSRAISK